MDRTQPTSRNARSVGAVPAAEGLIPDPLAT